MGDGSACTPGKDSSDTTSGSPPLIVEFVSADSGLRRASKKELICSRSVAMAPVEGMPHCSSAASSFWRSGSEESMPSSRSTTRMLDCAFEMAGVCCGESVGDVDDRRFAPLSLGGPNNLPYNEEMSGECGDDGSDSGGVSIRGGTLERC